jgi:putative phage-type endonuclease
MGLSVTERVVRIFEESARSEPQRSEAWLDARSKMLTASDTFRAIGGEGEAARNALIRSKRGLLTFASSPAMEFGTRQEDGIRDRVSAIIGKHIREVGLIRHKEHTWLGASVDGLTDDGLVIEIKAPYKREIVHGKVPPVYMAQVQVQLECLDLNDALFVEHRHCWPLAEEMNIVKVTRDVEWFRNNLPAMKRFMVDLAAFDVSGVAQRRKPPVRKPPPQFIEDLYP